MERVPERGDVIFVSFPFTDLSDVKQRPAVVLARFRRDDVLICQVTSRDYADPNAIVLDADAFAEGGLAKVSYAQAGKLFTGNVSLVQRHVGVLKASATKAIIRRLMKILEQGTEA